MDLNKLVRVYLFTLFLLITGSQPDQYEHENEDLNKTKGGQKRQAQLIFDQSDQLPHRLEDGP